MVFTSAYTEREPKFEGGEGCCIKGGSFTASFVFSNSVHIQICHLASSVMSLEQKIVDSVQMIVNCNAVVFSFVFVETLWFFSGGGSIRDLTPPQFYAATPL